MKITSEDCKLFISKNAKKHGVPLEDWKRISKKKCAEGVIRVFHHHEGYEIEILENEKKLTWLNTEKSSNKNTENQEVTFESLPESVKLFINTLRSLMGQEILDKKSFDKKTIDIWEKTIQERASRTGKLPGVFMHDIEHADDIWSLLHDHANSNDWNNENILRYAGQYFWFCFSNDPRQEQENPHLFITPKGFWDDGRVPVIFSSRRIKHEGFKNLDEIMESTVEFESESEDDLDRLKQAYQFMKKWGVDFSLELQKDIIQQGCASEDFCNPRWVQQNLEEAPKKLTMKKNVA